MVELADGALITTTEVVLQRYRGELTLLGGRGDSQGDGGGRVESSAGDAPPGGDAPAGGAPPPEKPPKGNDLDDDIPF